MRWEGCNNKGSLSGWKRFEAIAIIGDTENPITPCGVCRQFIIEFGREIKVIMANTKGQSIEKSISELLPYPFLKDLLIKN